MRHFPYLLFPLLALLTGCGRDDRALPEIPAPAPEPVENTLPEGYFVASFTSATTRAAISGEDSRLQNLRYLLFKDDGTFVKERVLFTSADGIEWPYSFADTLPKGSYRAVFFGNASTDDILTGYTTGYDDARINLPGSEMTDQSELYQAGVTFSDAAPAQGILLQRILSLVSLHRNLIDAQDALNTLVLNIVTGIGGKDLIGNTLQEILPGQLTAGISGILSGTVLNTVVNAVTTGVIGPLTDAFYDLLLQQLVVELGDALTANTDHEGDLPGLLDELLNPWTNASNAVVTIEDFPKALDFGLTVQDTYAGSNQFQYSITTDTAAAEGERDVLIKGFAGTFTLDRVDVLKQGLVGGVLIDGVVDSDLLLNGTLIDIQKPLSCTTGTNFRYASDYSLVDIGLASYDVEADGAQQLTLSLKLGDVIDVTSIVNGIPAVGTLLGLLLNPVISALNSLTITLPVNLPLLSIDNLEISGGWSDLEQY